MSLFNRGFEKSLLWFGAFFGAGAPFFTAAKAFSAMALNAPLAHFWLADLHVLCGPRTHAKPCSSVPVAFSPGQSRPGLPKFRVMRSEACDDTRVSGCRDRFWIGRGQLTSSMGSRASMASAKPESRSARPLLRF
jgi:hypothetical protein